LIRILILLIEDILLILIVLILTLIIFIFLFIILIPVPNVLMTHSEHILVLLLCVLSKLLPFFFILIVTVHILILVDGSLGLEFFLLELGFVEGFLGFFLGLPLLFDLVRVFKEGQRMH
jgi:hypothetical protein